MLAAAGPEPGGLPEGGGGGGGGWRENEEEEEEEEEEEGEKNVAMSSDGCASSPLTLSVLILMSTFLSAASDPFPPLETLYFTAI